MTTEVAPPSGFTGEKHPDIFDRIEKKTPRKEGQLSEEQLNEYYEQGYTVVHNFFTKEEIEAARTSVLEFVDDVAKRLFAAGKISSLYEDLGFNKRLIAMENEFPGANIIVHKRGILSKAMCDIASNDRILNLLEDIIGPDIAFNPVWNLRSKTPNNDATVVPWHQDCAYFDNDSYTEQIVTAWIPLVDATFENGTMEMMRGCHKEGTVATHTCCAGPTWYVMLEEAEMENYFGCDIKKDAEVISLPIGSFILFNNFTPHRSLSNTSDHIRWALDFRWQRVGTPGCLYGLKEPCVLRTADNPDLKPDWESFNNVDRNSQQHIAMGAKVAEEFNTVISGPWMKKWHIVNHNRHTDAFVDDKNVWQSGMVHG